MPHFHSVLALMVALLAIGCIAPKDRRPGLRLPGEVAAYPTEWSTTVDAHPLIAIEVRTPYFLPHSVTVSRGIYEDDLIIGALDPESKNWPSWVDQDANVRLGVGEFVYEAKMNPISDPATVERVLASMRNRPGASGPPADVAIRFWRVQPRD